MNRIAIVGATSQIARDLVRSFVAAGREGLLLYVREPDALRPWLESAGLARHCSLHAHADYGRLPHEAVINFVGVGDPRRAVEMGASIFDVTRRFDDMVLADLSRHPERRYLFLSSGAAYGSAFAQPAGEGTEARFPINALAPQDFYAVAKMHAEAVHRAHAGAAIVDLRVFNYFSRTQDIGARFFITDIVRAIRDGAVLRTSDDYMVRDYLHPADFHGLVESVLAAPPRNVALDCYSRAPIAKPDLLAAMSQRFGLRYEVVARDRAVVDATGAKPHYYSLNRLAAALGYQPAWSSLDGVLEETAALLAQ